MTRIFGFLHIVIISLGFLSVTGFAQSKTWIEDSFEDFQNGSFKASGVDLYVTDDGKIKSINRYDLNNDGYLDLVFNSGHDVKYAIPPTLYKQPNNRNQGSIDQLPVDGSSKISVKDLNNDGYDDLVFLPNSNGVSPRRYLTILWGNESENNWVNHRKTQLLTISPITLEIADLNNDSWPELIVLNGTQWSPQDGTEAVLRIYWGDAQGYQQNQYKDIIINKAVDFSVEDIDSSGFADLIILQDNPGRVRIFWNPSSSEDFSVSDTSEIDLNTPSVGQFTVADYDNNDSLDLIITGGTQELIRRDPTTGEEIYRYTGVLLLPSNPSSPRHWENKNRITSPAASDLQLADLDKDGWKDIILADRSAVENSVHILWGNDKGTFHDRSPVSLPVAYASAIDIADIDGDSIQDIAVAVYRSDEAFDSRSPIFFGDGEGGFSKSNHSIPSAGASDVLILQSGKNNGYQIFITNTQSGSYYEQVLTRIYWGSENGFDPDNVSLYDIRSGYTAAAADLNNDDYVDLVLLSIVHANQEFHAGIGFNILWGGPDGIKNERRTIFNEYGLYDVSFADLNRDGYLDLLGSVGYSSPDGDPPGFVIRYGGPEGFSDQKRDMIESESRPTQHAMADFNKDGFLDVALLIGNKHKISVYWGSKEGFSSQNVTSWPFLRGGDMNVADLNGDGWLDLVASSLLIPNSLFYDFGTYIFWGSPGGFDPSKAQKLIAHGTVGITISDWDQDGFLDVFLPSYKHAETRESIAAHLYWGTETGFSDSLRTDFMQDGGHGAMAADFNRDGKIDLAVSNHTKDGSHFTNSRVFYNQGSRFKNAKEQLLPTIGSEFIYSDDVGAQYNRSYHKQYTSSIFEWKGSNEKGRIEVQSDNPGNTELQVSIRTAESTDALKQASWKLLGSEPSHDFILSSTDGYLQYRLTFVSDNGDRYPEVDKVEISVSSE